MEIQSNSENDFLARQVPHGLSFWIGYSDQTTESVWLWNNTGVRGGYTSWVKGQPDNFGSGEDCAEMFGVLGRKRWNDFPCGQRKWFVCEKGKHVFFVLFS